MSPVIRTLERYVLGELLRTFAIALVALTFVFFLGTTFRLMKDELTYWQILKSLPYAVPYTLPHSLPMAFLVAVTLTFGRHCADREVLALESCGVAPRALAPPAVALGAVLCLVSLVVQSSYLPYCHTKMKRIQRAVLEEMLSLGDGQHWCRNFRNIGFDIYVRRHRGPSLEGVVIHRDVGDQPATITAEKGEVEFVDVDSDDERVVFKLTNAVTTVYARDHATKAPRDPVRVRFPSYVQEIAVGQGGRVKTSDYSTAELRELARQETEARHFAGAAGLVAGVTIGMDDRLEGVPVEIATRAAVATAPLVFLALAFPLVLALRSPNRLVPLVVGIGAACAFYFAPFLVGRTLAERPEGWPGWCFLGDVVALVAAAVTWPIARGGAARTLVARPLVALGAAAQRVSERAWARSRKPPGTASPAAAGGPRPAPRASRGRFSVWDLLPVKTLDRMLLRRFAFTYAAFASSVVLIFVVTDIFNKFYRFAGDSSSMWLALVEYYAGVLPEIYYMLAPFVTLIAAMWVVFELRRNNELTPLMAAGIPAWRVTAPILGAALFLSVLMFADREWVICNPTISELRRESGKFGKRDQRVPVPVPDCHDAVLAAATYLTKTRELFHAKLVQLDAEGRESEAAFASLARYVPPEGERPEGWLFTDGFVVKTERSPDGSAAETLEAVPPGGRFVPLAIRPLDVECAIDTIDYLSTEQMENQLRRIPSLRHLAVQLARRYSYPASCLVLLLIGLPFVLRGDKGAAALGILICIAVCALFFIASAFSEDLGAKQWGPPPLLAAWLPDVLFGLPGLFAFLRSAR